MGRAVDTVLAASTQAGAGAFPINLPAIAPDSLVVRSAHENSDIGCIGIFYQSNAVAQELRMISPLLHDNVTGFTFIPGENPALFQVPAEVSIPLQEQDTITLQGQCGAAYTITAGLLIDYDNIKGTDANLHTWGEIKSHIKSYKSIQVALNAIAVGAWTDTLITVTENQLHADHSYAVLGYEVSQALCMVGVKGISTGNLRYCGPGGSQTLDLTSWYLYLSQRHNKPYIPVFQANDRNGVYVSAANGAAVGGAAATVSLIVAELNVKM